MIRVLVVDDDFMVARLHSSVVAGCPGFQVAGVAHTGADAIEAVRVTKPDLVLLDIYLPDQSGLDVLPLLREVSGDPVDVIVISAAKDMDTVRQALHRGVFHYLIKPFEVDTLRRRLKEYAGHRAELGDLTEVRQDDLDRVFRAPSTGAGPAPPKGISPETTELVLQALERAPADGISATECAETTGLSRSSTRRYLEHLVAVGAAEMKPRYGVAGRPERRYRPV